MQQRPHHRTWLEACGQPDVLGHALLLRLDDDADAVHLVAERRGLVLELHGDLGDPGEDPGGPEGSHSEPGVQVFALKIRSPQSAHLTRMTFACHVFLFEDSSEILRLLLRPITTQYFHRSVNWSADVSM